MPNAILQGLSLVDTAGHLVLATTLVVLALGLGANVFLRARYAELEKDLRESGAAGRSVSHPVLDRIVRDAKEAARRSPEVNTQAIIEEAFHAELSSMLLAERFVRASTGLVIILGLLGTFYGLTLSVGRLVHLVSTDAGGTADVSQALTTGLTQALMGMAVAFSNSLLGIVSAVLLTLAGVFSNVGDRRTALMVQVETYLDRLIARSLGPGGDGLERTVMVLADTISRLDASVVRFESALGTLAAGTSDLREFNVRIVASKARGG
jgi:hypothetical protein